MKFKQQLNEQDYRQAYAIHYATYKLSRIRSFVGITLVLIGILVFFVRDRQLIGALEVLFGVYLLFGSRWYYLHRVMKATMQSKSFGEMNEFEIADGKLIILTRDTRMEVALDKFNGYHASDFGVFLYSQRNAFIILKRAALEESGGTDELMKHLHEAGLKEMHK